MSKEVWISKKAHSHLPVPGNSMLRILVYVYLYTSVFSLYLQVHRDQQ